MDSEVQIEAVLAVVGGWDIHCCLDQVTEGRDHLGLLLKIGVGRLILTAPGEGLEYLGSVWLTLLQMLPGHSSLGPKQAVAVAWYLADEGREIGRLSRLDHSLSQPWYGCSQYVGQMPGIAFRVTRETAEKVGNSGMES